MIRSATILCPGPSLAMVSNPATSDLLIGVNRAATRFRCDVWAVGDWPLIRNERRNVIGTPRLFTSSASATWLQGGGPWPAEVEEWEWFLGGDGLPVSATSYSSLAAVWYAVARGAKTISVYGADMAGTLDFDDVAGGENRTETRWDRERRFWGEMIEQTQRCGVTVARMND